MAARNNTVYGGNLIKRGSRYSYIYTVPQARITKNGGRREIVKALGTSDYEKARVLAKTMRIADDIEYGSNDFSDVQNVYIEHVVETAKRFGFEYVEPKNIEESSVKDYIEQTSPMVEARLRTPRPNLVEVATFGSAIETPALPMSKVFAMFKEQAPDTVEDMNEFDAIQRWRRYERSFEDFVTHMGDMDVLKLTSLDVSKYRNNLYNRIKQGAFKSDYANKHMGNIRLILGAVLELHHPGHGNPFANFKRIKMKDADKRNPMSEDEIRKVREKLETSNISDEAKTMIAVTANTGAGVKELCMLAPEDIVLDCDYPHIKLRPNEYRKYLKTDDRERELPLVGAALEAMKKFPSGFERYRHPRGPGSLNSVFHKFFKSVTPGKTFVSHRHRIAELMRNSECKDQHQNAVMGHATPGMTGYYGGKVWLENMHKALMEALPADNR